MIANNRFFPGTQRDQPLEICIRYKRVQARSDNLTVVAGKKDVAGSAQLSLKGTFLGTDNPVDYSGTSGSSGSAGIPVITVTTAGRLEQGDVFLISGTTSLAEGMLLLCQVYPAYFEDKTKRPASDRYADGIAVDSVVVRATGYSQAGGHVPWIRKVMKRPGIL